MNINLKVKIRIIQKTMEVQDNGIKIGGLFIPFTEDQINAIKCAKNPQKKRLDELGFYEPGKQFVYYIDSENMVKNQYCNNSAMDVRSLDSRNIFKTVEAAKKEKRRREIFNNMLKSSCEFKAGVCSIYFNHDCNEYCIGSKITTQELGTIYFPSKEIAQPFIDKYGDELHLLRY